MKYGDLIAFEPIDGVKVLTGADDEELELARPFSWGRRLDEMEAAIAAALERAGA